MDIKEFFEAEPKQQVVLFKQLKAEVYSLANKILWVEFKKVNELLAEDCASFIFEKLTDHYNSIQKGKDRAFVYSIGKKYFQELLFGRKGKTVYIEDLIANIGDEDRILDLKSNEEPDNDLETLKIEAVVKFQELIQKAEDEKSILMLCTIIDCIQTQQDYNAQFLSLYLMRKTHLNYDALYKRTKKMKLKMALSRLDWFEKVFKMYLDVEPIKGESSKEVISDWEKRAIAHFENHHDRFKSLNHEARHNRINEKIKVKSTPVERVHWIKCYKGDNVESDYYKEYGKSYRTFKADKRAAFN